ncbi:hypothetical protein [Sphingomonas ursincola]|uniref:Uncharacterized protein n=1 Tax=Sphingomonas ursincola TaxID=56361 RepID=A0A7V8RB40_9SPHN|nr:hypothetical protein [Sphingomonas ursincola]MBA1373189.1 hypothetical protein [Sphingomonas ursincola]
MITLTNSLNTTISGSETCPRCGGRAEYQAGTYDFFGDTMAAFRAPGVTRASVKAFADVVSSAARGELTHDQALEQAETINSTLATLFRTAAINGVSIDRLLNIISIALAAWALYSSEVDGDETLGELRTQTELHEMILQETQKQTSAYQLSAKSSAKQAEAAERIAEESREQTRLLRELAAIQNLQRQSPSETQAPMSRAERRRAEAIQRKKLKKLGKQKRQ